MSWTRLIVAAALVACAGAATSRAAEPITIRTTTAEDLAKNCTANPHEAGADARINFCRGFAQGAIDTERRLASDKAAFCFPKPGPSRAETMDQFSAWVRANPDRGSLPSAEALFNFLDERYPCKS
jgi:hypothetical protein